MAGPYLTIDLNKIERNARVVVELCAAHGIEVVGVTKGVCGHPAVARAMLRGGVCAIGDSQLENIGRMRAAGIQTSYMLLRVPPLSGAEDVVAAVDLSLNSELAVLQALSAAAARRGRVHQVIVMVEIGDLREGVLPGDVVPLLRAALELPGIRVVGLGANLACFAGVVPTVENMGTLVALAGEVERRLGLTLRWLSGINSSALELIRSGRMPRAFNHARIGEAILLGRETTERRPWPETAQDAFRLHAEVLEVKRKPSLPTGPRAEDAFGRRPAFEDRGAMLRALLNVGREDIDPEQLTPVDAGVAVLGASSGYLVADVTGAPRAIRVGDELAFWPGYGALVAAMTSEYVDKRVCRGGALVREPGGSAA